ncbi:MAG: HAD hydrolase-like protein, partial [Rhizobiaceae bacterium]|nr:HAD hydrolase-like protein [Rhizobiaceae bacterium]
MNGATWPRAILFDLDGTLIDSAPDIHAAVDELLVANGFAPLPFGRVKAMIGHGTRKLVERAFAAVGVTLDEAGLDARYEQMMPIYNRHVIDLTRLLPGVEDTLGG